jgi:hypothetical protein
MTSIKLMRRSREHKDFRTEDVHRANLVNEYLMSNKTSNAYHYDEDLDLRLILFKVFLFSGVGVGVLCISAPPGVSTAGVPVTKQNVISFFK